MLRVYLPLIGLVWLLVACASDSPVSREATRDASSAKVSVGSDVTLAMVGLGITNADFDELTRLALANDKVGGQRLIDSGRVLVIQSGTKAKIIEMNFTSYRVRIMSGPYTGRDGWVVKEAV